MAKVLWPPTAPLGEAIAACKLALLIRGSKATPRYKSLLLLALLELASGILDTEGL